MRIAYLFVFYAKGKATEKSDVDLLIFMPFNGFRFYEFVEVLCESKVVDHKLAIDVTTASLVDTLFQMYADGYYIFFICKSILYYTVKT